MLENVTNLYWDWQQAISSCLIFALRLVVSGEKKKDLESSKPEETSKQKEKKRWKD